MQNILQVNLSFLYIWGHIRFLQAVPFIPLKQAQDIGASISKSKFFFPINI